MRFRVPIGIAASLLLLLTACASISTAPPPVRVVVQTDGPASGLVDSAALQQLTEKAMARYAPHAAPATIVVRLDAVKYKAAFSLPSGIEQRYAERVMLPHRVPVLSATPWEDPVRGVIAGGAVTVLDAPPQYTPPQSGMRPIATGTYTIADADGTVLEAKAISVEPTRPGIYTGERNTAAHLAKRVAKLTHVRGDQS